MDQFRRIEARIYPDRVRKNIETMQKLNPGRKTLLVIKADAYGHGAVELAKACGDLADYLGVACIDEAEELRRAGITHPILILGYVDEDDYERLIRGDITAPIFEAEDGRKLSEVAERLGKKAKVHLKADSGMHRIGFACTPDGVAEAKKLLDYPGLDIEGIFTHFAKADYADKKDAITQRDAFTWFITHLEAEGFTFRLKHIDNSAGAMELHSDGFDMMRLGIVIYGLYPSPEMDTKTPLYPAMELFSRVVMVKDLPAGAGISYGWTFVTEKPMRVATISAGYADGYPRALSNQGSVLIHGKRAPILGRVCMDQFMVDVSDIPDVKKRDSVILMGRDGDEMISAEEISEPAASFNYEMVCRVSKRVPRIYVPGHVDD